MNRYLRLTTFFLMFACPLAGAWADNFQDTVNVFRNTGESNTFFDRSYGYAVFPSVGRAGIGGAQGWH